MSPQLLRKQNLHSLRVPQPRHHQPQKHCLQMLSQRHPPTEKSSPVHLQGMKADHVTGIACRDLRHIVSLLYLALRSIPTIQLKLLGDLILP
mmetsp:Transcript_49665/g.88753  ORF Transcript_49665/g.88753 Transcript_49665/m.88753 type:complete len:92 (-) Transcript_49665:192-467(-)